MPEVTKWMVTESGAEHGFIYIVHYDIQRSQAHLALNLLRYPDFTLLIY